MQWMIADNPKWEILISSVKKKIKQDEYNKFLIKIFMVDRPAGLPKGHGSLDPTR